MKNAGRILGGRRLVKGVGILIVLVSVVCLYVYANRNIRIERLDEMFSHAADTGQREEYFARKFPTSVEIDEYLADTTILHSTPPWGNNVFYFDRSKGYVDWRDKNVEAGEWWTTPQLRIMVLGGRWRIALVNTFCMWFFDRPAVAQQDNCYSVEKLDSILAADSSRGWRRESRSGNVFGLARNKAAPDRLANTATNIDSLLATQPVGWVEPLRNPSHAAVASMGFACTFAGLSFGGRGRSTHPTSSASAFGEKSPDEQMRPKTPICRTDSTNSPDGQITSEYRKLEVKPLASKYFCLSEFENDL